MSKYFDFTGQSYETLGEMLRAKEDMQEDYQRRLAEENNTPEVVPCCKCGCQMYQESDNPNENICEECKQKINS